MVNLGQYTDKKGAAWDVSRVDTISPLSGPDWHANSERYPSVPLSGAKEDRPTVEGSSYAELVNSIEDFAAKHTPYDLPAPKPAPVTPTPAPAPTPSSPSSPVNLATATDEQRIAAANVVVRDVTPTMGTPCRQTVLAIGWGESYFGTKGSYVLADGTPSFNWGALHAHAGEASFPHGDRDASGKPITVPFNKWPSLREGYVGFYLRWAKPEVVAAAERGDLYAVAAAMYGVGYFGGIAGDKSARIAAYAKMLLGAARTVATALGEPLAVSLSIPNTPNTPAGPGTKPPAAPSSSSSGGLVALAAAAAAVAIVLGKG